MSISLHLRTRWFNAIKNGSKTVEGRLNRTKLIGLKEGDIIVFVCEGTKEELKTTVTKVSIAESFRELYKQYGEKILPSECLTEEEKKDPPIVYDNILDYKEAIENGVEALGIEIAL